MNVRRTLLCVLALGLLSAATACGRGAAVPAAAARTAGHPAAPPTVQSTVKTVHSTKPPYTATLHLPKLVWPGHAALASRVNGAVAAWGTAQVRAFATRVRHDLATAKDLPASLPESSLTVKYAATEVTGRVASFRFLSAPYVRGAAQPGQVPAGLTFNLADGSRYALAALFTPQSGYAAMLDKAAAQGLAAFSPAGAHCYLGEPPAAGVAAKSVWWLAPGGLVLAFPPGVYTAAYCGLPTVTVSPAELKGVAAPDGPLAGLASQVVVEF